MCSRKILALIIATLMILTMLPVSAFADEQASDDVMIEEYADEVTEEAAEVDNEVVEEAAKVSNDVESDAPADLEQPTDVVETEEAPDLQEPAMLEDEGDDTIFVGADDEEKIAASKSVTDEDGDGVYDLKLRVTGSSNKSQSEKIYKSNVVIVIDVSGSMDNAAAGSTNTRLYETKEAAKKLVTELLKNNKDEDGKRDIVEISLIKFASLDEYSDYWVYYNGTSVVRSRSTSEYDLHSDIDDLVAGGGTNWEAALRLAKTEIDTYPISTDENVVETNNVIFLTDGVPTLYVRNNGNEDGDGQEGNNNVSTCFNQAYPYARPLVNTAEQAGTDCTFYSIFAYGSGNTGINYLRRLTNYAYGSGTTATDTSENEHCFDASDTSKLEEAFKKISDKISSNVGFGGVEVDDGLSVGATNSTIAVDGTVHPEAFNYTVYDEDGTTVLYTVSFDANNNATFKGASGNTLGPVTKTTVTKTLPNADGVNEEVTTDVYSVTVGSGDNAKTYEMTPATVGANGMIEWKLAGLGILEKWTYELSFKVWPNQAAYDIAADLNNGIYETLEAAINAYVESGEITQTEGNRLKTTMEKDSSGKYVVNTNYSQDVIYHQASVEQVEGHDPVENYEAQQTDTITPIPAPIPLAGSLIPMEKIWATDLDDSSELQELVFGKNGAYTDYKVILSLTKDGKNYKDYTFPKLNAAGKPVDKDGNETTDAKSLVWSQDAAIAPGMMVTENPGGITKTVTLGGKTYYVISDGHEYKISETAGSDYHFEFTTDDYHPMLVDGKLMNIKFANVEANGKITNGTTAEIIDPDMTKVFATNTLKGGINITKKVVDQNGNEVVKFADPLPFNITVNLTDEKGNALPDKTKDGVTYNYDYRIYYGVNNPEYDENATETQRSEHIYGSGTSFEAEIYAGDTIRVVNVESGALFNVVEATPGIGYSVDGYTYTIASGAQAEAAYAQEDIVTKDGTAWYKVKGNSASYALVTNKCEPFYVYHSGVAGDGNLETIQMSAVKPDGTYDLTQNLTKGTLYGGYYLDYAGKGDYADDGKAGTTGAKYTGMNYDWSAPQTTIGTAITPEAGETYYIKEVPEYYLLNYYQINYLKTGNKDLQSLYLISAVDDLNYSETGFILKSEDNQKARVASSVTFKNYSTNRSVTLKANTVFRSKGITGNGSEKDKLTFYDLSKNTTYFAANTTFTVLPYWKTPDGIIVNGVSTRTVTINTLTKSGISKTDS